MKRPADRAKWYHQPVLWLGLAVFVASLAGCVWVIVASTHSDDAPVAQAPPRALLGMPTHHHPHPPVAPARERQP